MTQRLRDLEHALSKVFSGDMSVEAGCVMDALTDLGWQLTPIAQTQPAPPAASTQDLPKKAAS